MNLLTATVVYHNSDKEVFYNLTEKISSSEFISDLFIVYNGESEEVFQEIEKKNALNEKVKTFFIQNKGLSNAYNYIIHSQDLKKYHLIINPDINFENDIFSELISFMENDSNIAVIGPKIINIDHTLQPSVRLLPDPFTLIIRRLLPKHYLNKIYELKDYTINTSISVPLISGCFMLSRSAVIKKIGGFDENFFLYFEDYDFLNSMRNHGKIIYFPLVQVEHHYSAASRRFIKFFLIHLKSFFIYFNKWGWKNNRRKKFNQNFIDKIVSMKKII